MPHVAALAGLAFALAAGATLLASRDEGEPRWSDAGIRVYSRLPNPEPTHARANLQQIRRLTGIAEFDESAVFETIDDRAREEVDLPRGRHRRVV